MKNGVLKKMAKGQAEMSKAAREGSLPLVMACHAKDPKTYLTQDSLGCSPIFVACSEGHHEIVEWLLTLGGNDILASDINGYNPLHAATSHGHLTVVNILLREGYASPEHIDRVGLQGFSSFFVACIFGYLEIAKALLNAGANINNVDKQGNTPLMVACKVGKLTTAEFLIREGASVNLSNMDGLTALQNAALHGQQNLVTFLMNSGGEDNNSQHVIHTDVRHG